MEIPLRHINVLWKVMLMCRAESSVLHPASQWEGLDRAFVRFTASSRLNATISSFILQALSMCAGFNHPAQLLAEKLEGHFAPRLTQI